MTDRDFTYWLQGFAELNDAPPSKAQWKAIREHLQLVFEKRTPLARVGETQIDVLRRQGLIGGQAQLNNPHLTQSFC